MAGASGGTSGQERVVMTFWRAHGRCSQGSRAQRPRALPPGALEEARPDWGLQWESEAGSPPDPPLGAGVESKPGFPRNPQKLRVTEWDKAGFPSIRPQEIKLRKVWKGTAELPRATRAPGRMQEVLSAMTLTLCAAQSFVLLDQK